MAGSTRTSLHSWKAGWDAKFERFFAGVLPNAFNSSAPHLRDLLRASVSRPRDDKEKTPAVPLPQGSW